MILKAAVAQNLSTEDIVKGLTPGAQTRSIRGITIEGDEKPLSVDLQILFEYNSDRLTTEGLLTLKRLGEALKDPRLANYRFRIAGHTDARGSNEYNQILSERRATAVKSYLVFQYDLNSSRIESLGYGKSQLADRSKPNDAINRRVQVINIGQ
jgi:outer membrane protein OmpA-like peptidoglycan-associated protein